MRDLRAFPLRGSGEESAWGVDRYNSERIKRGSPIAREKGV